MLREARQLAESIVETVREPLVVLDGDLRVQFANRSFYQSFQVTSRETEGVLFFNLGNGQWDIPELRSLLLEILPQQTQVEDFEIACDFPAIGRKVMRLNARRLYGEARRLRMILLAIEDITERERAEERFRQLIEGAPNGMVMVDGQGQIVLVNAEIEKSFGYHRDQLLGQPIEMLVPPRFHKHHAAYRQGFGSDPVARPMGAGRDLFGRRRDGSEFPVEIGLNPLKTDQGLMVLGTIVDITERKRAEEALRASEARFSIAFNASPISSVIATLDEGRYVAVNDTFLSLTGHKREAVIGRTSADLRVWPTSEARAEVIDLLRTQGRIRNRETHYQMSNGEVRIFLMSADIIELEGRPHLITASIDITERKHAQERMLRQSTLIDLSHEPILVWYLDGGIIEWNKGCEQLYGYSKEEAMGQVTHDLLKTIHPHSKEVFLAHLVTEGIAYGEVSHMTKDGAEVIVDSRQQLVKDQSRWLVLETNRDITERKQAEKEIRRLNEELEQRVADRTAQLQIINKELEAFAYSVSHDLRAPLRHINGFSQALLEDYADKLDEEGKGYLQEVRGASKEMAQLIDDLLQLSRVTRSEMRREAVNLSEIAQAVVTELQKTNTGRIVAVNIIEGLVTHGDKRLLQIMLNNLLGNAWKFTAKRQPAEIAFGQEEQDGEAVYFVRDNGAGFDMAYANKLFGAFQRLHNGGEFEGTGIGLATVQRIVRRHGGRVWAEGKVNQGATFYFTLSDFKEINHGE